MAKQKTKPLKPRDIQGLKYIERLLPLLDELHEVGCQRDKAGNRCLHYDQYCMLVLLYLFNPVVRSLRASADSARQLAGTSSGYRAGLLGSIAASCTASYSVALAFGTTSS